MSNLNSRHYTGIFALQHAYLKTQANTVLKIKHIFENIPDYLKAQVHTMAEAKPKPFSLVDSTLRIRWEVTKQEFDSCEYQDIIESPPYSNRN